MFAKVCKYKYEINISQYKENHLIPIKYIELEKELTGFLTLHRFP